MLNKRLVVLGTILTCASLNGMNEEGKRSREPELAIVGDRTVKQAREADAKMQMLEADFFVEQAIAEATVANHFLEERIQRLLAPGLTGPQSARIRDIVTNNCLDAQDARIRRNILDH